MAEMRFPSAPNEFCITDVGSTTTKALLFLNQAGAWRCFRYETPTTVEKPHEDVTVGVLLALRGLEHGQERGGDDDGDSSRRMVRKSSTYWPRSTRPNTDGRQP